MGQPFQKSYKGGDSDWVRISVRFVILMKEKYKKVSYFYNKQNTCKHSCNKNFGQGMGRGRPCEKFPLV